MDLLRLDRATGRLEPLVVGSRARGGPGVVHQNAQFTPDGRWILFDSDQTGIPTLYAYELASGQIVQVARTLAGLFDPTVIQTDEAPAGGHGVHGQGYRLSLLPFSPALWTRVDPPVTARDPAEVPGVAAPLLDPDEPDPAAPVAPKPQGGSPSPGQGVRSSSAVRPYRPWDSLRPRFALPLILEDEAGPVVGALTLGYDAYRERVYALTGGLGLVSGRPWVAFEYQGPLFGHPQATWALGVRQETLLEDGKKAGRLERELQLGLAYTWPGVLAATSVAATAKLWDDEPVGDGSGLAGPGQAVTLGVGREQAWPVDGRSFTLASGLSLTGFREGADGSRQGVVATWREQAAFSWNLGRQRLVLDGVVGTASLEEALAVGDPTASRAVDRSLWTLQAHGPTLTGRHALRITLGLESQLYRFSRGVGTWPLFFDDLGGRLYLEGGAVWSDTEAALQRRWGAGAELTLTTYLGYATPLTLGVGAASSIEPAGSPTLYLRVDLTDPVGAGAGGRLSGAGRPRRPVWAVAAGKLRLHLFQAHPPLHHEDGQVVEEVADLAHQPVPVAVLGGDHHLRRLLAHLLQDLVQALLEEVGGVGAGAGPGLAVPDHLQKPRQVTGPEAKGPSAAPRAPSGVPTPAVPGSPAPLASSGPASPSCAGVGRGWWKQLHAPVWQAPVPSWATRTRRASRSQSARTSTTRWRLPEVAPLGQSSWRERLQNQVVPVARVFWRASRFM